MSVSPLDAAVKAGDGRIIPEGIPGAQLNSEKLRTAVQTLQNAARRIRTHTENVSTSWAGLAAGYEAPTAQVLYTVMNPANTQLDDFADRVDKVSIALDDFIATVDQVKPEFDRIRADAVAFRAEIDGGVWVDCQKTVAYEWIEWNVIRLPLETQYDWLKRVEDYLISHGESTYISGSTVMILGSWLDSRDHVDRNNRLLDRVANTYEILSAAEAECANLINAQRDLCMAEVVAVEAWQLKGDGENAVDLPWGHRVEEDRNCYESLNHGIETGAGQAWLGFVGLVGWNHLKGGLDGATAGQSWLALATGLGSLVVVTSPPLSFLGYLGVPGLSDANTNVQNMLKGLVAWDMWAENPADALGQSLFNVGTLFLPGIGEVGAGLKIITIGTKLDAIAQGIIKLEHLTDGLTQKIGDLFTPHKLDLDPKYLHTDLNIDTHKLDTDTDLTPNRLDDDGAPNSPDGDTSTPPHTPDDVPSGDGGGTDTPPGTDVPGGNGPDHHGPDSPGGSDHPTWSYDDPIVQDLKQSLEDSAARANIPGYDPTGGLGWESFLDEYLGGFDRDGRPKWNWPADPPNTHGFTDGVSRPVVPGEHPILERITFLDDEGRPADGDFAAPPGTPFDQMSLPPDRLGPAAVTVQYEILKPLPDYVRVGDIAPGFGQAGHGIQYYFPDGIQELVKGGYLKEITP